MDKFELPGNILNDLKCKLCNEYLSYPPIMLHAVSGSVCGRCPSLESEQNIIPLRESNYECLARNLLLFPCRYRPQGCIETFSMQSIPKHEDTCSYKPLFCPCLPLGNCPWQGTPDESLMHFATDHSEIFLDSDVFELNIVENYKTNMLMPKNDNIFIIYTENSETEETFFCSVYHLKDISNKTYQYKIEFQANDCRNIFEVECKNVTMYKVNILKEEGYKINVPLLKEHLDYPMSITCSIQIIEVDFEVFENEPNIENNKKTNFNELDDEEELMIQVETDKMLIDIECPVCQEFMVPPIYQCQTGHSICNICKPQLHECPSCRGPLGQTRNFTLEKLTEHIMYQCKNRLDGCVYKANSKGIKLHEKECNYSPKKCPFYEFVECQWKGVHKAIISHIKLEHKELIIFEPLVLDIQYSFSDNSNEIQKITKCFGELFRLRLAYNNENRKIYATAQFIGVSNEAENYMYEVEIHDFSKKKIKCFSKKYCGAITDDKNDFKHCSIWTVDMITPFMSSNRDIETLFNIVKA